MASDAQGDGVFAKIKLLSITVAAVVVAHAVTVSAIEPPDMNRVTDEDKLYFETRLNKDQIEGLQRLFRPNRMDKPPCEEATEISNNLRLLKTVTPILREASTCADVSPYTRKYSAALAKQLNGTSKGFATLLRYYRKTCSADKEAGVRPD
jgi:hypothetical protein